MKIIEEANRENVAAHCSPGDPVLVGRGAGRPVGHPRNLPGGFILHAGPPA